MTSRPVRQPYIVDCRKKPLILLIHPVLSPDAYLEEFRPRMAYVEIIVPRVLELSYTANDIEGFAKDLGYEGPPFVWDEERHQSLQCELDAIFAHMYRLDRPDLEWILEPAPPSSSFPTLRDDEIKKFGEYRTQRYVLCAYDQLGRGEIPNLEIEPDMTG